jgi:hypothetical protein
MFNSPLLDVTIGLVFIFLLYSLLATSINEAIATLFGLRARMLKDAIITGMLSNTSTDGRWTSIWKGIRGFFHAIVLMFSRRDINEPPPLRIGEKFFNHPLIKNYGSSRIFPLPSYIPTKNFSTVLMDLLKDEFCAHLGAIASYKLSTRGGTATIAGITDELQASTDAAKLRDLFDFYENSFLPRNHIIADPVFDPETIQILQMHLRDSVYNIEQFCVKIENWYDDTMDRVGGWYKRQTQFLLFIIGLFMAVTFNVDIIQVSVKLSTDKDARDKIVQLAIQAADKFKDDPRVKKIVLKDGTAVLDTSSSGKDTNNSIFRSYQANVDSAKKLVQGDIAGANDILAVGWGDYGNKKHFFSKIGFVIGQTATSPRKILGFLILAFAVSLGSPFWFDLLNKLVKLRGTGTKEGDDNGTASPAPAVKTQPQQVSVTVNTKKNGEEAAG